MHRASTGLHSESGERAVDMYDWVEHQEVYEWVTSLYWTITTMTTIGYGDISAFTQQERCIAVVVMVLGCGFFAWSTGTITRLFTTQSRCKEQFLNKIDQLSQFMASRALPDELRTKIRSYYMLRFPTMKVFDDEQILQDLPVALARQVKESLFCDIVGRCMLFQTMNDDMVTEICVRLRSVYKTDDIWVTREGDIPDALYIVRFGVVSMYAKSRFLGNADSGDIFGENALLGLTPDGKRNRSAICITMCELCELRKDDLDELLRMEDFRRAIRVLVHSHLASMRKRMMSYGHVEENSFYCVEWNQLAKKVLSVIKREKTAQEYLEKNGLERIAESFCSSHHLNLMADIWCKLTDDMIEQTAWLKPEETKDLLFLRQQGACTRCISRQQDPCTCCMLRTRCTAVTNNIVVSSKLVSELACLKKIKPTWAALCFHWAGERYGPTVNWSEPFFLDAENAKQYQKDIAWTSVKIHSVSILHLEHHTNDWKSKPPIQVKLYLLQDPTKFAADASLYSLAISELDAHEKASVEAKYGLQFLANAEVPVANFLKGCTPEANVSAVAKFTKERYAGVMIPMSSLNAEWKQLAMSVSMNRILPAQSRWRRVMPLLKARGASEFFIQQQHTFFATLRTKFDSMIEKTILEGQTGTEFREVFTSVSNLNTQMTDLATRFDSQQQVLLELKGVTRELMSILLRNGPPRSPQGNAGSQNGEKHQASATTIHWQTGRPGESKSISVRPSKSLSLAARPMKTLPSHTPSSAPARSPRRAYAPTPELPKNLRSSFQSVGPGRYSEAVPCPRDCQCYSCIQQSFGRPFTRTPSKSG